MDSWTVSHYKLAISLDFLFRSEQQLRGVMCPETFRWFLGLR